MPEMPYVTSEEAAETKEALDHEAEGEAVGDVGDDRLEGAEEHAGAGGDQDAEGAPILSMRYVKTFGRALFGTHWQADFSRELTISKSLLSRTLRGERVAPPNFNHKIKEVVLDRVQDAFALLDLNGMPFHGSERMAKAQGLMREAVRLLRGEDAPSA